MLRRLGVRFTSRHWEGNRVRRSALAPGSAPLAWGFVPQDEFVPHLPAVSARQPDSEAAALLYEHAHVSLADFKAGAHAAYTIVAKQLMPPAASEKWCAPFDMQDLDTTTPSLAQFLNEVRRAWLLHQPPVLPRLEIAEVEVDVLSVDIMAGFGQKRDTFFGRWDATEILHHIRDSFEPEMRLPRELRALQSGRDPRLIGPCRLVADVLFTAHESFGFGTPDGAAVTLPAPSQHHHVWSFEADIANPSSSIEQHATLAPVWRVRNINDSIVPA